MQQYKKEFIEFMLAAEVLTFGDFTTKSGRKTPYFINTGKYRTGKQIAKLGEFYAQAIDDNLKDEFTLLYGPAYKGIPLAVTTAVALSEKHNQDYPFCFNRKEAKDHGEGGSFIGQLPQDSDSVLIVEDVVTAGTAARESIALLNGVSKAKVTSIVVSVDRMEKGTGERSTLQELAEDAGIKAVAIVTIDEIIEYLSTNKVDGEMIINDELKGRIADYRRQYGAK